MINEEQMFIDVELFRILLRALPLLPDESPNAMTVDEDPDAPTVHTGRPRFRSQHVLTDCAESSFLTSPIYDRMCINAKNEGARAPVDHVSVIPDSRVHLGHISVFKHVRCRSLVPRFLELLWSDGRFDVVSVLTPVWTRVFTNLVLSHLSIFRSRCPIVCGQGMSLCQTIC
jgi:hypothetical protein